MPYFLEDQTGELTGSEYVDIHNRLRFSLRCTLRDAQHTAYMIYDMSARDGSRNGLLVPVACLDFGANHALGTVKIGERPHVQMHQYLAKVSSLGRSVVLRTSRKEVVLTAMTRQLEDQEVRRV